MKAWSTIFILLIFFSFGMVAQNYSPIKDVDVLEQQNKVLQKIYSDKFNQLKIKSVYNINDKHTAIGYIEGGSYSEVVVNSDKKDMLIVLSSYEIAKKDIPKLIHDVWEKDYSDNWELDKVLYAKTPYGDVYYVTVMKQKTKDNQINWKRVFYNDKGQKQTPPI